MTPPTDPVAEWAESIGWRWDASCRWFAIDLHENSGGPLTTVLNRKSMELFYQQVLEARIDERKQVKREIHKQVGKNWMLPKDGLREWAKSPTGVADAVKHCVDYLLGNIEQDQDNAVYALQSQQQQTTSDGGEHE